jgi:hypothetical protein
VTHDNVDGPATGKAVDGDFEADLRFGEATLNLPRKGVLEVGFGMEERAGLGEPPKKGVYVVRQLALHRLESGGDESVDRRG